MSKSVKIHITLFKIILPLLSATSLTTSLYSYDIFKTSLSLDAANIRSRCISLLNPSECPRSSNLKLIAEAYQN